MFLLLFALTLTPKKELQHETDERVIYQRLEAAGDSISEIWRPDKTLLSDYEKARKCYVLFHLDRVPDCSAELNQVEADLELQVAAARDR